METLGVCTYMGGGPTLMYAAEAVRAYDEFSGRLAPAKAATQQKPRLGAASRCRRRASGGDACEHLLQFAGLVHLAHDVAAADELAR